MKNAEWMIRKGMQFSKLAYGRVNGRNIVYYDPVKHFVEPTEPPESAKELYSEKSANTENLILKWLDMEHKEPILDEVEKRQGQTNEPAIIKWIRTKNALPPNCMNVLIVTEDPYTKIHFKNYAQLRKEENNEAMFISEGGCAYPIDEVKFWAPFPELPEGINGH